MKVNYQRSYTRNGGLRLVPDWTVTQNGDRVRHNKIKLSQLLKEERANLFPNEKRS